MSGQDNSDSGFDQQSGPDPFTTWADFFGTPPEEIEGYEFMHDVDVQDYDNTLPTFPVQGVSTLHETAINGAGPVNGDINPSQFSDLPMFESPPAHTFDAEPMPNMPLVNADQTVDQPFHTTPPAQAIDAQPMSNTLLAAPNAGGFSPIDFGLDVNNNDNPGLINNTASADQYIWPKPYPLYEPLSSQYPSTPTPMPTVTAPPGHYPVPIQREKWPVLERTLFQRDQAMAPFNGANNNSLPTPAAPPALRKLAPKPACDVGATTLTAQDANNDVKLMPPPVDPLRKETKTQPSAPKKKPKKPTTSKAKQTAVKQPIDDSQLLVSTLEEAKVIAIKRIQLKVVDDDRDAVAAHPEVWVPKIAKALEADFRKHAEGHERLTEAGRAEFTRWQVEHENKAWGILSAKEGNMSKFAQACAMIFYEKVLEAHELGLEDVGKTISNGGAEITIKCSERINAAITAIEDYAIVKYDLLRQDRLEGLLASPSGFHRRKEENMLVNYKKKKNAKQLRTETNGKASRAAPKAKNQGKRKRKTPSPPASDDESEENDVEMGESDEEFVQSTKRSKRN